MKKRKIPLLQQFIHDKFGTQHQFILSIVGTLVGALKKLKLYNHQFTKIQMTQNTRNTSQVKSKASIVNEILSPKLDSTQNHQGQQSNVNGQKKKKKKKKPKSKQTNPTLIQQQQNSQKEHQNPISNKQSIDNSPMLEQKKGFHGTLFQIDGKQCLKKKNKKEKKKDEALRRIDRYLSHNKINSKSQIQAEQKIKHNIYKIIQEQLELLHNYFLDDIYPAIPFKNGRGKYKIIMTGDRSREIKMQWSYQSIQGGLLQYKKNHVDETFKPYPLEFPKIQFGTNTLNLLQKEQFNKILQQHNNKYRKIFESYRQHKWQQTEKLPPMHYILDIATSLYQDILIQLTIHQQQQLPHLVNVMSNSNASKIISKQNKINKMDGQFQNEIFKNIVGEFIYIHDLVQEPDISLNQQNGKEQLVFNQYHGRYEKEFEELEMIGQGGFGKVYKVRNKTDSNIYAIKKIALNFQDPKQRKLIKQVAVLSKLNHPNIVRYHQSWIEDPSNMDELLHDMSFTGETEINQIKQAYKQWHRDRGDIIQFVDEQSSNDSMSLDDQFDNSYIVFANENASQSQRSISRLTQQIAQTKSEESKQQQKFPFKVLYIVMQYCQGITLKQYIANYGRKPEQDERKVQILRGILQGLTYIHSKKIIHRDLKPANIFLDKTLKKPKIGDFGLATGVGTVLFEQRQKSNSHSFPDMDITEKTVGVGTKFYRAPEQISTQKYDQKVDLYSLGIIMFELWFPFDTQMQRYQHLNYINKQHKLMKNLDIYNFKKNQYIQQIQQLVCLEPQKRPSAQKLLESFRNKYFTHLVSCIANPKFFQFYELLKNLFNIRNQSTALFKRDILRNYVIAPLMHVYQLHRGCLFQVLPLIPIVDYKVLNGFKIPHKRDEKFLFLSEKGVIVQYQQNLYSAWIRYAKQAIRRRKGKLEIYDDQEIRRYSFEKIADFIESANSKQASFRQKYQTCFDIAFPLQTSSMYYCLQMLKISASMTQTQPLTQTNPPIYISHSKIYIIIAKALKIPFEKMYAILLQTSQEKFNNLPSAKKMQHFINGNFDTITSKKIVTLLERQCETGRQWIQMFKPSCLNNTLNKNVHYPEEIEIRQQIQELQQYITLFDLPPVVWKLQIPPSSCCGFHWNTGPVRGFTSIQEIIPGDNICNLHLQMTLTQAESEPDVSIWSTDNLQQEIMQVINKCWEHGISTKWYNRSLGEKDQSCRNNIIIRKKNQRIYMTLRKRQEKQSLSVSSSLISKDQFDYQSIKPKKKKIL